MQNLTLSVSQINNYIKNIFDNEEILIGVSVYGEITNFKISNNIAYFDIKEEGAQLSCVKFGCYAPFAKNGDKVIVTGKLNYHVKLGKLSFAVSKVEPYGIGELYKKFLELKARLESEGLFDISKKQPIPKYVKTIGVVTSETGAVIRDIYKTVRRKNPYTNIIVYPARVQGMGAEKEIVEGIEYFNNQKNVDVIIVARGGGSFEDLAPFNTEVVARAGFASEIPIISAIGHQTDFSLLDFVSDQREPTPTAAAEKATFDYYQEITFLDGVKMSLSKIIDSIVKTNKEDINNVVEDIVRAINNKLSLAYKDAENLKSNIINRAINFVEDNKQSLSNLITRLEKSNPLAILKSGYAKVLVNNKTVDIKNISIGETLETHVDKGVIYSRVEKIKEIK